MRGKPAPYRGLRGGAAELDADRVLRPRPAAAWPVDDAEQCPDRELLADFQPFLSCQQRVSEAYGDTERWTRMSILNTARSGKFSSDRTIREYCRDIWNASLVPIQLFTHADVRAGLMQ